MKKRMVWLLVLVFIVMAVFPAVALADEPDPDPDPDPDPTDTPEPVALLNLKFYLIDSNSYALPGYIVTIDNDRQSVADDNGIASFAAVPTDGTDTFKIFTPDKKQVGVCNLSYVKSDSTSVGPSTGGGGYQINYSTDDATIYLYMIADPKGDSSTGCHPADASDSPLTPGKQPPKPTPSPSPSPTSSSSAKPTASASASATASASGKTDPAVKGYVTEVGGVTPIANATVESLNNETGKSYTVKTDENGYYEVPAMAMGDHTFTVTAGDGSKIGYFDAMLSEGNATWAKYVPDSYGTYEISVKAGLKTMYMNVNQTNDASGLMINALSERELPSSAPPLCFDGVWQAVSTDNQPSLPQNQSWFLKVDGDKAYEYADIAGLASDSPTNTYDVEYQDDFTAHVMVGAASTSGNVPEDFYSTLIMHGSYSLSCAAYRDNFVMDRIVWNADDPNANLRLDGTWEAAALENEGDLLLSEVWYMKIDGDTVHLYENAESLGKDDPANNYKLEAMDDGSVQVISGEGGTVGGYFNVITLLAGGDTLRSMSPDATTIFYRMPG